MTNINSKKLIAKVIPVIKLPRNITQFFSYAVPERFEREIKKGALVEIPFRKRKITGIVFDISSEETESLKFKLKEIANISEDDLSLSEWQIRLVKFISDYYYTSPGIVIKPMIPATAAKEARKKMELNQNLLSERIKVEWTKGMAKEKKILLLHNFGSERHNLYYRLAKKEMKKEGQVLILMPEFFNVYNFANFYRAELGQKKTAILTSELTKNQYFEEWKKVRTNAAKIVIGTRQAIFAPFKDLKLIIVDNEHNSSYKQWDMNPRYHAVKTAEKLAEIWKAKIILSSPSPSLESYYKTMGKTSAAYRLKKIFVKRADGGKLELVNMEEERKTGNYSILSEILKNNLLETIYKRRQAIVFIPRLGENTVTKCKDCGYIKECENCHSVLVTRKNQFYCTRCKEKSELMKECPKCRGQNISSFGYGAENVEKEIGKLFRDKNIKISRLDSESARNKSQQFKIYKDFINKKVEVLIGTQMAIKDWGLENLSLVAVLLPEIIFNQPDFRTQERAFQFLIFLRNLASQGKKVIIQIWKKENDIFRIIKSDEIENFYLQELQNRKSVLGIGYPPRSQLIKLIHKNPDPQRCEREARTLFSILEDKIKNDKSLNNNFEVMPPFPASSCKQFGKYRWHIIIKSISDDIGLRNRLLNFAKKDWIIDIDPESVL